MLASGLGAMFALLLVATSAGAQEWPSTQPVTGWEYRFDDPVRAADGTFRWSDESGWRKADPLPVARGEHSSAWFRVRLPTGEWPDPALFIPGVDRTFEAWFDGRRFDSEPRSVLSAYAVPSRGWFLLRLPTRSGGHELLLHVRSLELLSIGPYSGARFGDRASVLSTIAVSDVQRGAIAIGFLACGVIAAIIYLRRREQPSYLFFALFCAADAAVLLALWDASLLLWPNPAAWWVLLRMGRAIWPVALLAFSSASFDLRAREVTIAGTVTAVVAVVLTVLEQWFPWAYVVSSYLLNVEFFGCLAALTVVLQVAVREHRPGAAALVATLLLSLATGFFEVLLTAIHDWPPELFLWSQLLVVMAMGNIVLERFSRVFRDVQLHATELEARNVQLREVESKLQREVRARDEFLSIASHELRNPLAVLEADAHLLTGDRTLGLPVRGRVEAMRRQLGHLTRMVDDLLDVARISREKLSLKRRPLLLAEAAGQTVKALRSLAYQRGLELRFVVPDEPLWVDADETRLDQILTNLVRNAIKYTPARGEISVLIAREGDNAVIRVRDTGVGMEPQALSRLFKLFEQGNPPEDAPYDGLGIGLALVRQLVELHQGTVTARSDGAGKGSEFSVFLPLAEPQPPPEPVVEEPAPEKSSSTRVLLVDDNANLRASMRIALQLGGFTVAEAPDGKRGVEEILGGNFDAAVIDLRMPELDGYEVARRVVQAGSQVRLIALTGHSLQQDLDRARAAGFEQVLVKPIDPGRLMDILERRD